MVCMCVYAYLSACLSVCLDVWMYVYMHARMCMWMRMYVCVHVCMFSSQTRTMSVNFDVDEAESSATTSVCARAVYHNLGCVNGGIETLIHSPTDTHQITFTHSLTHSPPECQQRASGEICSIARTVQQGALMPSNSPSPLTLHSSHSSSPLTLHSSHSSSPLPDLHPVLGSTRTVTKSQASTCCQR